MLVYHAEHPPSPPLNAGGARATLASRQLDNPRENTSNTSKRALGNEMVERYCIIYFVFPRLFVCSILSTVRVRCIDGHRMSTFL